MRFSKPLYSILGIYMPLSVLILWVPLPGILWRRFYPARPDLVSLNEKTIILAGFLCALGASCYAAVTKNSVRNHRAAAVRGGIIAAAAAYALLSLLRGDIPFVARFFPSPASAAAAVAAIFTWASVISLGNTFGGLELFESLAAGRRGDQLREVMREYAPEMSKTDRELKSLARSYMIQFVPPCLLMIAPGFSRIPLPLTVFTLAAFSAGFLLVGFLRLLRRELACASEGISLSVRDRSLPLPVMALGTGIAALLALAGSSDSSLLPPGIILTFIAGIFQKLFSFLFRPLNKDDINFPALKPMSGPENMEGLFPVMEETGPWPGWKWVKAGIIALASLLFLYFMFYPLLRRSGFSLKAGAVRAAIARWLENLKKGFSAFFAALRNREAFLKMKKIDEKKFKSIASELFSGSLMRRELKQSVNFFARLILWGIDTMGVPWKPSLAPGEYCALLAAAVRKKRNRPDASGSETGNSEPDNSPEEIIRCGVLFEKALYSGRPPLAGDERDLKNAVQKITGFYI